MMKVKLSILILLLTKIVLAQQTIEVAEKTFKIGFSTREEFYFGFAEGDKLIFNFEVVNGKEIKELEIIEMPSSSKFMDYKAKKIENKTISINKTSIYKFIFTNTSLGGRICKVKISRIPASDATKNFDTNVYTKTVDDTTITIEQERYLVKSDTTISNFIEQVAKVHSGGNLNGNRTSFNFTLPDNTIAWSYYVGVNQEGQQAFKNATKELASKSTGVISSLSGYGPLAALALNSASYITQLQAGEDIDYYIVEGQNANLFLQGSTFNSFKRAKVINDFCRMTKPLQGHYHFCLYNDNAITGVDVTIKMTAIVVTQEWGTKPVQKISTKSKEIMYLK